MAESDQVFRFAVGASGEPRSGIYRLWAPAATKGKHDVYFNLRAMGEEGKVSLHTTQGHFAFSKTAAADNRLDSRFMQVWERTTEDGTAATPDFELFVPTSELHPERMEEDDEEGVVWIPPARRDGALRFLIVIHRGRLDAGHQATQLCTLNLAGDRRCDLLYLSYDAVPEEFVKRIQHAKSQVGAREPDLSIGQVDLASPANRGFLGFVTPDGKRRGFIEVHLPRGLPSSSLTEGCS